ncbi:hypothetical protein BAUCODRAFT_77061 [Baudoinia panamericana UAMH 10762]|uniref:non-specific serine/threonine protein kinase n=1 Tax=Baudoinia panamericana (strain UAMH 10762) TaxID=717646 RepID=M2N169_BAUPA|nr:uncharacterized protein BAUCODRAFT_77061 [Baudoinia panamericana UAMH 10762]EMC92674.1 hypothetical protein BAUCODRAFT_77061 [Baudoinia panamericana UAMH 10762]
MADGELQRLLEELGDVTQSHASTSRRRKRRKLNNGEASKASGNPLVDVSKLLAGAETEDVDALCSRDSLKYGELTEDEQCQVWKNLAELAPKGPVCILQLAAKIIKLPSFKDTLQPRVLSVAVIQVCIRQIKEPGLLDLAEGPIGQHILASLHSSLRELRIAAGQCLPMFLHSDLSQELLQRNRHTAVEYLRTLSDREETSEHETLIPAWGQIAVVCGDRERNLALLRLSEYLGHPNSLVAATAFEEVERVAAAMMQSREAIFKPYWSSVAVSIVQDLFNRPQRVQQVCDLLNMDLDRFLMVTQQDTVPALVLAGKKDILRRIARTRESGSVKELCMHPKQNLAGILALLLTQPVDDPEEFTVQTLAAVSSDFEGCDIADLVRIDLVLVACELLKRSADASESRKSRLYRAIQVFACMTDRRPGQSKNHGKGNKALYGFLEAHVLGIMAHFSQLLDGPQAAETTAERLRALKAISDLIHLAKKHVSTALPQLRASLQSAMEHAYLRDVAFSAWLDLLAVIEVDDIATMLNQTFALVAKHWSRLPGSIHAAIHDCIGGLINTHNQVMHDSVEQLPSLRAIPLLSKFGAEIERLQDLGSAESRCRAFVSRLREESSVVVHQALQELVPFLTDNQEFILDAAASEQPVQVLSDLFRALLDVTTRHAQAEVDVAELCGKALGIIGCPDPNRVEAINRRKQVMLLSNFGKATEAVDWVLTFLEQVLVKAFRSVTNSRAQGFLAFVMQELLKFCGFTSEVAARTRSSQLPAAQQRWLALPENVRITLTPFLSSAYMVFNQIENPVKRLYPSFSPVNDYGSWLRSLVYDLMWRAKGDNAKMIFPLIARLVRNNDLAIASFILPYAALNVVLGGTVADISDIRAEILAVLKCQPVAGTQAEYVKQSAESVFSILDYMANWLQEKKKILAQTRAEAYKTGHPSPTDFDEATDIAQIEEIERFLASVPAESLATRAVDCGSYARALFHWEQFIRQQRALIPSTRLSQEDEEAYERLHSIYACIDEPDGLEGLGTHLTFLTEDQQTMQHVKAGRWTAASVWYETRLAEMPDNTRLQMSLLHCFRETGQYAPLLRYTQAFTEGSKAPHRHELVPLTVESSWMVGDLMRLRACLEDISDKDPRQLSTGIGRLVAAASAADDESLLGHLRLMRTAIVQSMTESSTNSVQASHTDLFKLHTLYEIEAISSCDEQIRNRFLEHGDRRLAALGSYNAEKQYLLGVRRALMRVRDNTFTRPETGALWLTTARLARKAGNTRTAYNAVIQASSCGDQAAKLEEARLLWHDNHQRQAIQALEASINTGIFESAADETPENSVATSNGPPQSLTAGKAYLQLAKWLDASGQSQAKDMTERYQYAAKTFQKWEKGHYYLGKHYQKLLEVERGLAKSKQSPNFQSGEMTKSVIENLMRSIPFGNKYWHETIPKVLTLWLDLGMEALSKLPAKDQELSDRRTKALQAVNRQFQKYYERIPPYVFYTALPQMLSRISHPHQEVWKQLCNCMTRIINAHPSQAMWYVLPVVKATDRTRAARAEELLNKLKDSRKQGKGDGLDIKALIVHSQKLSDALLQACEQPVESRRTRVSLSRDLMFNTKLAPIPLVVPLEATLSANLPTVGDVNTIRRQKAFAQEKITIQGFSDDVLVLSSLQRPKKVTVRGSDGKMYGLLCKPKDDLRKDQRLMDFNGIINRALKRDPESSKRRLYIKTYAVTPLSEESGTLEWVEGIKPLRDILLNLYSRKGVRVDYNKIRERLDSVKGPENAHIFTDDVLSQFPAVLHEWFTETYPDPETWFTARLRYARSAAVMSMTGHMLGLGDRHGENILLEEGTGGVFHVDFNCLFDKGKTFDKPELVPFRLTHNMVDAMGAYGYEGPFRRSSELTLALLRQNKDTLMTVLETFLHDPTTDFVKKKRDAMVGVPNTPQEILDSVGAKLKGLYTGENVPLGVEGYVDVLIQEATSSANLAGMYIGWCAFL